MNPNGIKKLKQLGEFIIITSFAGVIFQLLSDKELTFMALIMGGFLGLGFGLMELYVISGLRKYFLRLPLILSIVLKSLIYLVVITLFSGIVGLTAGLLEGLPLEEFYASLIGQGQIALTFYTFVVYLLLSLYVQINLLLGEGVFYKFMLGKYRKPVEENRIFMFLDIKSSTSLAEKLGHDKYYSLINDFFHEISEPVRSTKAEIYQYVGDEVVFTWKTHEGLDNANCIKIFYKIKDKVYNNRKYYRDKYGDIPNFKAGVHFGDVLSAQIGDIKREIVYNGDVLNTSSRIQEQCNVFERDLLISGTLLNELDIKSEFSTEKMDTIKLRGKETSVELYSLAEF